MATTDNICKQNFHHLITTQGTGYAVNEFSYSDLIQLMQFPELPFQSIHRQVVKSGNTTFLVKTDFPIAGQLVNSAYKRVRRKNIWKVAKSFFQTNHALHCFDIGHALLDAGIATPRPLVVMIPHRLRPDQPSYLAIEWAEHSIDLNSFCQQSGSQKTDVTQQNILSVAVDLGQLLGKMHAAGFSHRDLKSSNILVQTTNITFKTMVIDLDGASHQSHISLKRKCWNLSRLALDIQSFRQISLSTQLRFLKSYLAESAVLPASWKVTWQKIKEMTTRRMLMKRQKATKTQKAA